VLRRLSLRLQVYGVAVLMTGGPGNALPETAENRSSRTAAAGRVFTRLKPLWTALLIAGLGGAVLTILADFATVRSVKVLTASCDDLADPSLRGACVTRGHELHSWALVLIGAVALLMVWGAVAGRSRAAAAAVLVLGTAVLVITFGHDVPRIHKTGVIGVRFEQASAHAGPGLWMETVGGGLLFVTGAIALAARPRTRRSRRRPRSRSAR
jgi:hypothetical protein